MRPIPDDVQPVPPARIASSNLADGGSIEKGDGGSRFVELPHGDKAATCADARHKNLRVHQVASDRWIIARQVVDVIRTDRKAQLSQQIDQNGAIAGVVIEDIGEAACLEALGFRNGDLIRSVNAQPMDWSLWSAVYQSITKDGTAVVRLDRGGKSLTWLYEVRND
jgi:hypothetical protein